MAYKVKKEDKETEQDQVGLVQNEGESNESIKLLNLIIKVKYYLFNISMV